MAKIKFLFATLFATCIITSSCGSGENTKKESSISTQTTGSTSADTTISAEPKKEETKSVDESTSSSTKNWDKVLEDYGEYVDDYIVLYKKAMKGDAAAIAEYPAVMQKAQDLQKSLQDARTDKGFTVEHASKMMKIQQKMLDAVSTK